MNKFSWIPLLALLLSACEDTLQIKTSPVVVDTPQAADPTPVKLYPIQWIVVTKDNLQEVISKMSGQSINGEYVFLALSTQDYKNLILNIADLGRYIEQQKAVILYYRNITTAPKSE